MILFAEDNGTPATVWAVLMTLTTGAITVITLIISNRSKLAIKKLERQKELREELARQKAAEAADRAAEMAEMKKERSALYQKWREIAQEHKEELEHVRKIYAEKCAECMALKIQLEECLKHA